MRKTPRNPKQRNDGKSPNTPKEGTVITVKESPSNMSKKQMLRSTDLRKIASLLALTPPQKRLK